MNPDELIESWRRTAEEQLARAGFQEVVDQRNALGIPFVVRLVASVDDVELGPWVSRIAEFLRGFGFDVVIQDDVSAAALLQLPLEPTDIFLVWSTSSDLQTFCASFPNERRGSGRLIVCVPDGHDGMLYCRLLREEHGVETVSLPSQKLANNESCRFGLDLLIRCADVMLDKVAIGRRDARVKNTYVLLVHGIRTRALWQGPIRETLQNAGLVAWPTNYKKFEVIRFLQPFERLKQTAVRRVETDIKSLKAKAPGADITVLAHSFGSYIVGQLLGQGHTFTSIALCGSVLPSEFDFSNVHRGMIVNEVGRSDVWPVLAEKLGWGYGSTGTFGFNRGVVTDRVHATFRHSTSLTSAFCEKFWVPFFCDERIQDSGEADARPSWTVRVLDRTPFLGAVFWLSLGAGGLWGLRVLFRIGYALLG